MYDLEAISEEEAFNIYAAEVEAHFHSNRPTSNNYPFFRDTRELAPSAELLPRFHVPVYIDTLIVNDNGNQIWPWKKDKGGNPALSITVNFNRPPVPQSVCQYRKGCIGHGKDLPVRASTMQLVEDHNAMPGTFERSLAFLTKKQFYPPAPFTLDPDSEHYGPRIECGVVAYSTPGVPRTRDGSSLLFRDMVRDKAAQRSVNGGIQAAQLDALEGHRAEFLSSLLKWFMYSQGFGIEVGSKEKVQILDDLARPFATSSYSFSRVHDRETTEKIREAEGLRDIMRIELFATDTDQPRMLHLEEVQHFLPSSSHAEGKMPLAWWSGPPPLR